ncbi:MAG: glycerol-3-phosphate 1-O-acyltransferase PlsB, partial [Nevskiales bacterium]
PGVSELESIIEQALSRDKYDVQIVPVSVFWGRDPGKETSLFRIAFSDAPLAGSLRKFFIVLANGRNTLVHFGKPISVREFISDDMPPRRAGQKLNRVLRIHFNRQRTAALGPSLSRRARMLDSLIATPKVQKAIVERARQDSISRAEATAKARAYGEEIAADFSIAAISFVKQVVTWMERRLFDWIKVYNFDRIRDLAHEHALVYLPSHRSHLDYMTMTKTVYDRGLVPPHIAAGINMNFWPVGILLRRCGAFYLRRSFSGNALYTEMFRAYVDLLLNRGYSMKFYPEGGRSRTGRLLRPKTGMLSMVVQSYIRERTRPVSLVPIFIGYDKVLEVSSYYKELGGKEKKKKESTLSMLRAGSKVGTGKSAGGIYVGYGKPVNLGDYLDEKQPGWRDAGPVDSDTPWLFPLVSELADEVMVRMNMAACLNPTGLVALILLSSPRKAMAEDELLAQIEHCIALLQACPYSEGMSIGLSDPREILELAIRVGRLQRVSHPWGDVISAEGRPGVLLTYNRNSIQHLLVLPSMLARQFKHHDQMDEEELIQRCLQLYPFLRKEMFLRWNRGEAEAMLHQMLDAMIKRGLLLRDADTHRISSPSVATGEMACLLNMGRMLRETLERLCMTTFLLADKGAGQALLRKDFEEECRLMAERITMLSGVNSPEFFDPGLFRNYIDTLQRVGLLKLEKTAEGEETLHADAHRLRAIADQSIELVDLDVLQAIQQLIGRSRSAAESST